MFPQIFGKYMLEREIAAGGMARVYLATLRGAGGFEKRLVVKQIRPELASDPGFVERFVKEAKTAVELSHPNIVPVYELGLENGVYYIAMEHCDGATLSDLLSATGPLDAQEAAHLGVEVCRALDYAHRRAHIVHRDVTPRNVLIDEEGAVRLIDFGIAAPATEGKQAAGTEVFGSPGHMPPEQLLGHALTPATDVFAVGVLLYEALTGRPAFRRATAKDSRAALSQRPPPIDSDHQELRPLAPIVARCMDLDESQRPENAEVLARPLREFLRAADSGDVARRLGERVRIQRRRARGSSPWLLGEGLTGLESKPGAASPRTPHTPKAGATPATPMTPGTRTFATSPSFTELTRRAASEPPPALASGSAPPVITAATRPLPPSEPPPPMLTSGKPKTGATRPLPFSEPPPPLAGSDGTPPASAPLEARHGQGSASTPNTKSLYAWLAAALTLLVVVGAGIGSWGDTSTPRVSVSSPKPMTSVLPTATVKALVASAASSSEPAPSVSLVAVPRRMAPKPSASTVPVASAELTSMTSTASAGVSVLSLTALPGTQVSVGGQSYPTPVTGLSLPAGRYQVTFRNAAWDGPVSAAIVLLPGKASRVHADFTHEPPRVVVR